MGEEEALSPLQESSQESREPARCLRWPAASDGSLPHPRSHAQPPERETEAPRAGAARRSVGSLARPAWCWVGEGPALLCGACGAPCGPVGAHVRCGRGFFPPRSGASEGAGERAGPRGSLSSSLPPSLSVITRRDAEDAVYGRDGYDYDGYRLRVEFPRSGRGTGRGGGGGGGGGAPRGRYGPPSRRSENRVVVSGELTWCGLKSFPA